VIHERSASMSPADPGFRAMLSPRAQAFFDYASTSNLVELCRGHRRVLLPNWNVASGIPSAGGFYSLYTAPQDDLRRLWSTRTNVSPALADVLGVRWITSGHDLFSWDERASAQPLVTAGQGARFGGRTDTLRSLEFSQFNPRQTVWLPDEARAVIGMTNAVAARVLAVHAEDGLVTAQIEAAAPTLVVVSQTHYPGWRATVNGQPTILWRANHAFQAVEIPAGLSRVRLEYHERTFGAGLGISIGTLGLCVYAGCRRRGSSPRLTVYKGPAG
jgi:hypothetical protein